MVIQVRRKNTIVLQLGEGGELAFRRKEQTERRTHRMRFLHPARRFPSHLPPLQRPTGTLTLPQSVLLGLSHPLILAPLAELLPLLRILDLQRCSLLLQKTHSSSPSGLLEG